MAEQSDLLLARLDERFAGIRAHLDRIEAAQTTHTANHTADAKTAHDARVALENRITKVEGTVSARTWLGAAGVILGGLVSVLTHGAGVKP